QHADSATLYLLEGRIGPARIVTRLAQPAAFIFCRPCIAEPMVNFDQKSVRGLHPGRIESRTGEIVQAHLQVAPEMRNVAQSEQGARVLGISLQDPAKISLG